MNKTQAIFGCFSEEKCFLHLIIDINVYTGYFNTLDIFSFETHSKSDGPGFESRSARLTTGGSRGL